MHVNTYSEEPVRLAVSLANRRPRTASELRERCVEAGVSIEQRVSKADLVDTMRVLDEWLAVVDAPDEHVRVLALNAMLAAHVSHPRVTDHAGDGWHIHFRDDRSSLGKVLSVIISAGTAFHLVGRGMNRLGRCADPGCDAVFGDFSRTGVQRYCSLRCNNRDAVRRHRTRVRVAPG
jgi:predicted RNA-binding Zn ribbon-like protein